MTTASKVISALAGKSLVTAESLTGGGIGAALTAVSGASKVFKGGIISYTDQVKHQLLGVSVDILSVFGAVSAPVAEAMAPRKQSGFNSPTVAYGVIAPTGESDCLASSRLWVRVPLAPPYADVAQSGERSPQEGTGRRFKSVHWQKQLPMV